MEKISLEEFKELLYKLHSNMLDGLPYEEVCQFFDERGLRPYLLYLLKKEVITLKPVKHFRGSTPKKRFFLGPKGLELVGMWEAQELNKKTLDLSTKSQRIAVVSTVLMSLFSIVNVLITTKNEFYAVLLIVFVIIILYFFYYNKGS